MVKNRARSLKKQETHIAFVLLGFVTLENEIIFSAGVVGLQFKMKLEQLGKVIDFTISDLI